MSLLSIDRLWDGERARPEECVELTLHATRDGLEVRIDAPFHDDPPPPTSPGSTDGLWDFEVVELFLLGRDARYLEIELGPHAHHLVLALDGVRNPVRTYRELQFRAQPVGQRWHGDARIPRSWLPERVSHLNAYAIHGCGDARRFLAWRAVGGAAPDFHRLERFGEIDGALLAELGHER